MSFMALFQQTKAAQECQTFNWFGATIDTVSTMTFSFVFTEQNEAVFDVFELEIPGKYNLPTSQTPTELTSPSYQIFPDALKRSDFDPLTDVSVSENSSGNWLLSIKNLRPLDPSRSDTYVYSFQFQVLAPSVTTLLQKPDVICRLKLGTTTQIETTVSTDAGSSVPISQAFGSQITVSANGSGLNGEENVVLTLDYLFSAAWQLNNYVELTMPKNNLIYDTGLNNGKAVSLITDSNKGSVQFIIDGTQVATSTSWVQTGAGYTTDIALFSFQNGGTTTATGSKTLKIALPITYPTVNTSVLDGFDLRILNSQGLAIAGIGDANLAIIEEAIDPTDATTGLTGPIALGGFATTDFPTRIDGKASIVGNTDGVSTANASYQMEFITTLPIPSEGIMVLTVPSGVTVPNASASSITMTCNTGCSKAGSLSYSNGEFTIKNAFQNGYLDANNIVRFTLTGFTNPADTVPRDFTVKTYFDNGSSTPPIIEGFSGMQIQATEGVCNIQEVSVVGDDRRIYAESSYEFKVWCSHAVKTTYGLKIVFPIEFIVMNRSSCTFTGYSERYNCQLFPDTNTIEIRDFTSNEIPAKQLMTFTVNSVLNPGTFGQIGLGTFLTMDASQKQLDVGTWQIPQGYYTNGNITDFTVNALSTAVGEQPVKYQFNLKVSGEIFRYSYFLITLPEEVWIPDDESRVREFEDSCGENLFGVTNTIISCVITSGGSQIKVKDGFLYQATTNLTDSDGLYFPPDISFTLDGFQNPRTGGTFGPFNITVLDRRDKVLYAWNKTDTPTIRVSGISQPSYIEPIYENQQNGASSWLEFLVTTTGGLTEGDKIVVKLPFGWQFTQETKVFGRSNNLANVMESVVSVDQRQIEVTAALSFAVQRRLSDQLDDGDMMLGHGYQRDLQATIPGGLSFQFRITDMKNRHSYRPADSSIQYFVYSQSGILYEEATTGMMMVNTQRGDLNVNQNGIVPGVFRTNFETNYTLSFNAENFEKNMIMILILPVEIDFGDELPLCTGVSGTSNTQLICQADRQKKTLTFTNAMQFADANPGKMVILLENLKNPKENQITSSFKVYTQTFDGYWMDQLTQGVTINFYCEYPCAECPEGKADFCELCYQTSVNRFFHENKCLTECPQFMVETEDLLCIDCLAPCVTCDGTPDFCTLCIDGYYVVEGGMCREEITWYFPFIGMAFIFFLLITISEITTKRVSNFKESLIAFWSIPEVLAWGTLIWFMWARVENENYATGLAVIACIFYVCLNSVHAIIHPRYMVPNSLYSYKQLLTEYKCGTFMARAIAYLISFKFSLILVSHFFNSPRLKGDYSAMNWKQFNRFSLAFVLLPYACMMASCIIFILTDGFWSYPGFVAAEVICLSTFVAILLAIDAISAIKCKTVGKKKTNKAIRVATGADYESDEDEINLRKKVQQQAKQQRRPKDQAAYGDEDYDSEEDDSVTELKGRIQKDRTRHGPDRRVDSENSQASYNSRISQQTAIMNDEARKQIAMLEELAHQMREEKRQLQMDKEKIENEKTQLHSERARTAHNMEQYMEDYQRQTATLGSQVKDMERQKIELVHHVETRLEEGNRANEILALKVKEAEEKKLALQNQALRKNFRDFEGEMEDYEPVEEENSEDAQSSIAEVVDSAQLPVKPSFGQIDYYRHMEGEDQHWMQQITPRAGGDSMLGQHDMEDDMELQMEKNATAHFEIASIPPSRYDDQMENGVVEAEYQEMTSQVEACQSEEYQQRSDAEMEINSDIDEKIAIDEEHFIPERAIFSQLQDREERNTQAEFFQNVNNPVFEELEKPPTRHGIEVRHFVPIEAQDGEGEKQGELVGETQHFFKQEQATFGEVLEEGEMERQATAQHFFNPEMARQGEADDVNRSGLATPMEHIVRTAHAYGDDVEDPNAKEAVDEQLFNAESAVRDDVSNMRRSVHGSDMVFQEREAAMVGNDVGDNHEREGTEHQFFQREDAMYSQDKSMAGHNATAQEFFKNDEAIRGDIVSQDRSVAATQQNYFANVDQQELGRPEDYHRSVQDVAQDFMNKSELGPISDNNRARGAATPIDDRSADQIDYMNKSEAEFGRQSTVHDKNATKEEFFEQDQNPEFGRGEQFTRNKEQSQEYNPTPVEDSSGRSESSEGGIANHQPFTAGMIQGPNDPNLEQVKKVLHSNPNARKFEEEQKGLRNEAPDAALISPSKQNRVKGVSPMQPGPQGNQPSHTPQPQGQQPMPHMQQPRQAKTILYSDKSETSVEDLMDDTPSNYNIQNGRFEGKSLGLKALLLHAKNYQNQTLDPNGQGQQPEMLQGLAGLADQQNRSPQHARPGNQLVAPGFLGAQKGIIGSQNDERQFINNLYQTGQSSIGGQSANNQWRAGGPVNGNHVPTVGEESSNNGDAMQQRNTRNQVRTNKQFVEDPRNARGGAGRGRPPAGNMVNSRSPNAQQQMGRGAPKVTKNNYFGGSAT